MTFDGRSVRRSARVARSQFALRLGLALYAAVSAAVLLRCMVLILGFPDSVGSVATILVATDPIVLPLTLIPGAHRGIVGSLALSDLTAAVILVAAPLPFLGRQSRRQ
jgi:hypothetical protein